MSLRRASSVIAAVALSVGVLVNVAAPAQAAASITDNGNGSATVTGVGGLDFVYFCSSALSQVACWNAGNPQATYIVNDGTQNQTYWAGANVYTYPGGLATSLPAGTYRILTNNGPAVDTSLVVTLTANPGGSSTPSGSTGAVPAPVTQQFGKPATGTCDEAQPAGLNWAGVPSGGWGITWAQWMNGGLGGVVCSRSLVYSSSAGAWTVQ